MSQYAVDTIHYTVRFGNLRNRNKYGHKNSTVEVGMEVDCAWKMDIPMHTTAPLFLCIVVFFLRKTSIFQTHRKQIQNKNIVHFLQTATVLRKWKWDKYANHTDWFTKHISWMEFLHVRISRKGGGMAECKQLKNFYRRVNTTSTNEWKTKNRKKLRANKQTNPKKREKKR